MNNSLNRDNFNFLFTATKTGLWSFDVASQTFELDDSCKQLSGASAEKQSLDVWLKNIHPQYQGTAKLIMSGKTQEQQVTEFEYRFKVHDEWVWILDQFTKNSDGSISGIRNNIDRYKNTEDALIRSQNLLNKTNNIARIGTWELLPKSNTLKWSEVTKKIHEVPLDYEPKLSEAINFYVDTYQDLVSEALSKAMQSGSTQDLELKILTATQKQIWVRAIMIPVIENGECTSVYGAFQDINNTKTTQLQLSAAVKQQRIFIDQAPNAIAMFNRDVVYLAASKKWYQDYNLGSESIIGKSHYEVFPEIGDDWKQHHQDVLAGGVNECDEALFIRKDGSEQYISWNVRPWYNEQGNVGGIIMITDDITDKVVAKRELVKSEEQFRKTFEESGIGMGLMSISGKWLKINSRLSEMSGYPKEEFMGLGFQQVTHPDDLDLDRNLIPQLLAGEIDSYNIDRRYIHKKGHLIYTALNVSLIRDANNQPLNFICQFVDISKRVLAQEELKKALLQIQTIFNATTHVSIIGTDTQGLITTFNKGAENLLGYSSSEIVGKHSPVLIHASAEIEKRGQELSAKENKKIEGFEVFVHYPRKGKYDAHEWTYIKKDGTEITVQLVVTAVKNQHQEITGFLGVAVDISAIKEAQEEVSNLLDVTTAQNKRLLNFAHIVSHNLRSHVVNLSMTLDFLHEDNDEDTQKKLLSMLHTATNGLEETVRHLNEVVSVNINSEKNLKSVKLNKHIKIALGNVEALLKDCKGTINTSVKNAASVLAIPAYLDSVLLNVLTNAIKYRSPNRALQVNIQAEREAHQTIIKVTDNGLGIDLKLHRAKLFGMYKTFHKHKDARGIGLFITKNQIEAMGGTIDVESTVDEGTTFIITLKNGKN